MGKIDRFCEELQKISDQCIPYAGEGYGGIGCSEYICRALRNAGIIKETESFWAGQGQRGVLTDTSRFQRMSFNPATIKRGDILYSHCFHVLAWDGVKEAVWEGAPKASHGVCDNGRTGVGHRTGHGYRNCGNGTYNWSDVYRIIDTPEKSETAKESTTKESTIEKVAESVKDSAAKSDKAAYLKTLAEYLPDIKYGSTGSMVKWLQTIMKSYGWYTDAIDGQCGPKTVAGIRLLQTALGVTVDGQAGKETWTALLM